jgi:hypothetical protein
MSAEPMATLDEQIGQWRNFLRRRRALNGPDVEELETHLRDQVRSLTDAGLAEDEAFLVAVKRMGSLDALSREFAREHSERLWKQLVMAPDDDAPSASAASRETFVAFALAVCAAIAIKLPELFGYHIGNNDDAPFYVRSLSLFVFPFLAIFFAWKRGMAARQWVWLTLPFVAVAALVRTYTFQQESHTLTLTAMHTPIAFWLTIGVAYADGRRFGGDGRMDFVRFSGELVIYFVLIAIGGGVLTGFTVAMFEAIGLKADTLAGRWLIPCGGMGAIIVASWLVEAKQSVIENMAPVLTRLFTPLFTLVLLTFIGTMLWTGRPIDIKREVLISFDLLLAVVLGLVLYSASARTPGAPPNLFDRLQMLLIVSALAVDVVALTAIASRISEFGFTPNRVAALGENLILLVNLAWSAWLYAGFLRNRQPFLALEHWQMRYLPVYSVWAAFVVVVFPPVFAFG